MPEYLLIISAQISDESTLLTTVRESTVLRRQEETTNVKSNIIFFSFWKICQVISRTWTLIIYKERRVRGDTAHLMCDESLWRRSVKFFQTCSSNLPVTVSTYCTLKYLLHKYYPFIFSSVFPTKLFINTTLL